MNRKISRILALFAVFAMVLNLVTYKFTKNRANIINFVHL